MPDIEAHDQSQLDAQLSDANARISELTRDLHQLDDEISVVEAERAQVTLLNDVVVGLEKLDEIGAGHVFWEGRQDQQHGARHVRRLRERLDDWTRRRDELVSAREKLLFQLDDARAETEYLEEDLLELQRAEQEKKNEWVIEREESDPPPHAIVMPWSRGGEDDARFRRSIAGTLGFSLLFAWLITLVTLPTPRRGEEVEVPERLTRLIEEQRPVAKPPPVPVEPVLEKDTSEEPKIAEKTSPQPSPASSPSKKPAVASKGILAFRENFAGLASNVSEAESLLGARAKIDRAGDVASSRAERSMVTSLAPGASSGINVAALSREVVGGGGAQIEGVEVTQASSAIGEIGGPERPLSSGPGPARTDEEIQIVFDRHKASLYRLYNRALRKNPTLRGQMVLRLTIEPDGSVSLCELHSNDMAAPRLGEQVVGRVKSFDFGVKEGVPAITILYPIDFLPAT